MKTRVVQIVNPTIDPYSKPHIRLEVLCTFDPNELQALHTARGYRLTEIIRYISEDIEKFMLTQIKEQDNPGALQIYGKGKSM